MRVIVLGAGVVGTASAWYLARAGHEVTVIERQGAAGLETSYANGGQISASHAEPWAHPGLPAQLLQWLGREGAPLVFRPRAEWRQWAWGVRFEYGRTIKRLEADRGRVRCTVLAAATGRDDPVAADAYVVALGSYSPLVLAPLGISIPVYPLKGYSVTVSLDAGDEAPTVSLKDVEHKLVFSRLGDRLRVAGTAEMDGYNTEVNDVRCEAIARRAFDLFPGAGHPARAEFWTGLRPATPSNVPCVGRTRYPNLFLNTGHGTLGWTLACGSGQAIADIVSGRVPVPDFRFMGMPARSRAVLVANPGSG